MPYIKKDRRNQVMPVIADIENPGELNYAITEMIHAYMYSKRRPFNYQLINDVLGALEGAKLEFYRRVAVPYEDAKIKENGDVYG